MKSKKIVGWIVAVILVCALAAAVVLIVMNFDAIKKGLSGGQLYTQEDMDEAHRTWEEENKTAIENLTNQNNELKSQKESLEQELEILIAENNAQNAELQAKITELQQTIASLTQEIEEKEAQILALQINISDQLAQATENGYNQGFSDGYSEGYDKREQDDQAAEALLVWDGTSDTSWYGSGESSTYNDVLGGYVIFSAKQLAGLSDIVASGNTLENETVFLANDLTMSDTTNSFAFKPIGDISNPFKGTFNGQNHTISGLLVDDYDYDVDRDGLFGYSYGANIVYVTVDSDIQSKQQILDFTLTSEQSQSLVDFLTATNLFDNSLSLSNPKILTYRIRDDGVLVPYIQLDFAGATSLFTFPFAYSGAQINCVEDFLNEFIDYDREGNNYGILRRDDDYGRFLGFNDYTDGSFSSTQDMDNTLATKILAAAGSSLEGTVQDVYMLLSKTNNMVTGCSSASMTWLIATKLDSGEIKIIEVQDQQSFIVMSQDMSKENAVEVEIRSIVKTKEADPYPGNLLSEPFAFESIDASNETIPVLPSLDKSLGLVEGQTYKVVFSIDGETFELEKPCFAGDTPNNIGVEGALTLSNMTNTNGLIAEVGDYRVVILIAQDVAVVDGNFAYQQGTTSFLAQATVSDGYLADVIFDIVITAIVPV